MRGIPTSKPASLVIAACLLTVFFPMAGTVMADSGGADADCVSDGIEEALNDQPDRIVTVCAGTYDLASPIAIAETNVTLEADGAVTLTYNDSAGTNNPGFPTINVEADDVRVEGFTIERDVTDGYDGSERHAQAVKVGGSGVSTASDVEIVDNEISFVGDAEENITTHGVGIIDPEGGDLSGVTVTNNSITGFDHGVSVAAGPVGYGGSVDDVVVQRNQIVGNEIGVTNVAATVVDARVNWWGTPAGPASELVAGAVIAVPWCLDQTCETVDQNPEPPEAPEDGSAVEIIEPTSGASFAPGADITVTWLAPIDDLFLNEIYRVELLGDGADDRGVEQATGPDEACTPLDANQWRCQATLEDVDVGEDKIITVRPTVTQNETLAELTAPLCYTGAMAGVTLLCDAVSGISVGQITTLTPEPADGWTNQDYEGTIDCEIDACEIRYDVHDPDTDAGPYTVAEGSADVAMTEEGEQQLSWFGIDENGNEEDERSETIKIDQTFPDTSITLDGTEGDDGWFTSEVDVTLDAEDELSGVDAIEYRLDDGPWTTYTGTFDVVDDGEHDVRYRAIDVAGNIEAAESQTVAIDTTAPSTSDTLEGDQNDTGVYTTPVDVTLSAEDDTSGVGETEYRLDDGSWTTYDGSFEVSEDGEHTVEYRSTDVASNQEAANDVSFEIDKPAVIDLELRDHDTFLPNGQSEDLVFEATWVEGENEGEAADGETIVLSDADSSFEETATTNADGLASFSLSETDLQRTLSATIQNPTDDADVNEPSPTTITWTDITVERVAGEDVTDATQGWADVGDTYRVAYQVNTTWDGEPLEGATVTLDNGGDFTSTGADGIARVPTSSDSPTETTFAAEASYNPADGPEQTASAQDTATVKWAKVVFENLEPNPADATHWYDPGEVQTFSFEAYLDFGDDRVAAEDAEVTIEAVSNTSDADETESVVVAPDATASADLSFADNARTTPTLTLTSTQQGITVQDAADFGDQRWATLVVDDLNVTNQETSEYRDGWHAVGDQVTFDFTADLVYGADRQADSTPAEDTQLTFDLDGDETVTVSADGEETVSKTITEAFQGTPSITLDQTPEGVTETDIATFDDQRWTEIELTATPDDDFVNVGDQVTFDLDANWAHDGSPVTDTEVAISFESSSDDSDDGDSGGGGGGAKVCDPFTGSGTCTFTREEVHADNLTFSVNSTDVGITQQTDDQKTEVPMVWTEIEISSLDVDDAFVDVGKTVEWNATAFYAHTDDEGLHPSVGSATLALGDEAPSDDCSLDTGVVDDGDVTAEVTCDAVVDERIPLTVASADEDVTLLAEPLELFDTNRAENAVWTGFFVDQTVTDEDGNELADGTLLDHNEPVRFEGSVQFAHMADNENATEPPTDWVEFTVEEGGSIASNCIEEIDANGSATCVTEVRKEEGNHTFTAGASSFDEDGDGIFVRDVTEVLENPDPVRFRWTSIAFEEFHCEGSHSGVEDCETFDWTPGERVDVTVTAVEADTGNVLANATVTIDGNEETTDESGTATRSFISFGDECLDVTAAGEEATIEDQTVTWDRPRTETICWQ